MSKKKELTEQEKLDIKIKILEKLDKKYTEESWEEMVIRYSIIFVGICMTLLMGVITVKALILLCL